MREAVASGAGGTKWLGRGIVAALAVGAVATLYVIGAASIKPDDGRPKPVSQKQVEAFARDDLVKLEVPPVKRPAPSTPLVGPEDRSLTLADYRGKVVVVNLWATWCPPCVAEMPTLARLQRAYPQGDIVVAAVSVDGPNQVEKAKAFLAMNTPLRFHHSPQAAFAWAADAKGFPTTIIYDKAGFERARLSRPAEWDSPAVRALLDTLVADPA